MNVFSVPARGYLVTDAGGSTIAVLPPHLLTCCLSLPDRLTVRPSVLRSTGLKARMSANSTASDAASIIIENQSNINGAYILRYICRASKFS
jgi:hypothetical protein